MMGGGGVRPVASVTGPAATAWLRRRRDGLEAQHRALDEGRIDDLVQLIHDDDPDGDRPSSHEGGGGDEAPEDEHVDAELAREVSVLALELEGRLARMRTETLAEIQDLDRRVDGARFGGGRPGAGHGRRGGNFSTYL